MPFKHTARHNDSLMRIQYLFIIPIVSQIYWTVVLHNAVLLTAKTFIPLRVQFIRALHLTSSANHFKCPAIEIYYPFVNVYLCAVSDINVFVIKIYNVIRDDICSDIRLSENYNMPVKKFHRRVSANVWIWLSTLLCSPCSLLSLSFLFIYLSRDRTFPRSIRLQFSFTRSFPSGRYVHDRLFVYVRDFSLWLSQFFSQ